MGSTVEDVDQREAASGSGDRVAFAGVGLFSAPKPVQFGLERGPVGDRGPGRVADR